MEFCIPITQIETKYLNPKIGYSVYLSYNYSNNDVKQKLMEKKFKDKLWRTKINAFTKALKEITHLITTYDNGYFPKILKKNMQKKDLKLDISSYLIERIREIEEYPHFCSKEVSPFMNPVVGLSLHSKEKGIREKYILTTFCYILNDILPLIFEGFQEPWQDYLIFKINFDLSY